MARSIKFSDDTYLDASGVVIGHDRIDSKALKSFSNPSLFEIGNNFSFSDLITHNDTVFFRNWNDGVNFPNQYGVGILFSSPDPAYRFILYI